MRSVGPYLANAAESIGVPQRSVAVRMGESGEPARQYPSAIAAAELSDL